MSSLLATEEALEALMDLQLMDLVLLPSFAQLVHNMHNSTTHTMPHQHHHHHPYPNGQISEAAQALQMVACALLQQAVDLLQQISSMGAEEGERWVVI
jgi:hypothetical protein